MNQMSNRVIVSLSNLSKFDEFLSLDSLRCLVFASLLDIIDTGREAPIVILYKVYI